MKATTSLAKNVYLCLLRINPVIYSYKTVCYVRSGPHKVVSGTKLMKTASLEEARNARRPASIYKLRVALLMFLEAVSLLKSFIWKRYIWQSFLLKHSFSFKQFNEVPERSSQPFHPFFSSRYCTRKCHKIRS
jgi:hypothetical protein